MTRHVDSHLWYRYLLPKRLTLKCNPPIYRWLFWVWGTSKDDTPYGQPSWAERHGVNCYYCGELIDERECVSADDWNDNDGGTICTDCQIVIVKVHNNEYEEDQ